MTSDDRVLLALVHGLQSLHPSVMPACAEIVVLAGMMQHKHGEGSCSWEGGA